MKIIEIAPKKVDEMSEIIEDILILGGKLMSCIEKLKNQMYEDKSEYYGERLNRYSGEYGEKRATHENDMKKIEDMLSEILERKARK